jgi:hypothetical protein
MRAVVAVARTRAGEGQLALLTPGQQVVVEKFAAVVASIPSNGNGMTLAMSSNAATTHFWALFGTDRFSVQPVAMSVTVSV